MAYTPFYPGGWQDYPSTQTPIDAAALNHMETGIEAAVTTLPLALGLVAATPLGGYVLVNGTGTILSWTAPNDGQNHRVVLLANLQNTGGITAAGGTITATVTTPDGSTSSPTIYATNQTQGFHNNPNQPAFLVKPGTTFTVQQTVALTASTVIAFIELWAS